MSTGTQVRRFGWPLMIGLVALSIHFLGLYVAPLRTELRDVEVQIQSEKRKIAYLEAEFSARASADRLNQYNELLYGYGPPTAAQYLAGENALAELGGDLAMGPPVMISVADGPGGVRPAGEIGSVVPQLSDAAPAIPQLSLPIESDGEAASAPRTASDTLTKKREAAERQRTQRLASLDRQLLSDETLRSISVEASRERAE